MYLRFAVSERISRRLLGFFAFVALAIAVLSLGVASSQSALGEPSGLPVAVAQRFKFSGTDLSVIAPRGVKVTARKNLPDFDVYDFSLGGHYLLSAYVGRDPDFHMFSYHPTARVEHRLGLSLDQTDITYRTTRWGATREVLLRDLPSGVFIHFFYENVPVDLASQADRVIVSATQSLPNPFVGSWETSMRSDGVVLLENGRALFFNEHHGCPTIWATYVIHGHTVVATELEHHGQRRTMDLDANGLLHERDTMKVYHRARDVEFHHAPGADVHC